MMTNLTKRLQRLKQNIYNATFIRNLVEKHHLNV